MQIIFNNLILHFCYNIVFINLLYARFSRRRLVGGIITVVKTKIIRKKQSYSFLSYNPQEINIYSVSFEDDWIEVSLHPKIPLSK